MAGGQGRLEDLAFRFLEPGNRVAAGQVAAKRAEAGEMVAGAPGAVEQELAGRKFPTST